MDCGELDTEGAARRCWLTCSSLTPSELQCESVFLDATDQELDEGANVSALISFLYILKVKLIRKV